MKYIIFEVPMASLVCDMPIIFPNSMAHSEVAAGFGFIVAAHKWDHNRVKAISAGEFNIDTGECSGRSDSLGLDSRGDVDTRIIAMSDYGGNFRK